MDVKQQQVVYHDWEAPHYDDKWAISFDRRCIDYVAGRFRRAVPDHRHFDKVLEVGAGTGFFLLNLAQTGVVGEAHCTDLSPGMVAKCVANGRDLGIDVHGRVADAEALPYPTAMFDLVVGHAVLHHLPDVSAALRECRRVLKPGGRLVIAGEPSYLGDSIAGLVKRAARIAVKLAVVVGGAERMLANPYAFLSPADLEAAALETAVDLHVFGPSELEAHAQAAGFTQVRVMTEELTANWFGWGTRTVEAMLRPGILPGRYPFAAYRMWQALFALDNVLLRRLLPRDLFYNCIVTGTTPPVMLVR